MGSSRPKPARRLGAREAERLLTGQPAAPDRRGLVRLLAAAAAPPRADELAGERAAVEGFRRVYQGPAERPRPRLGPALRRTAAVKVLVGVVVLFLGGTALAAGTGELPGRAQQSAHDIFGGVPAPHHLPGGADPAPAPRPGTSASKPPPPAAAPPAAPGSASQSPGPDLAGLCRTYLGATGRHETPDPAVRDPLAAAAGDQHKIASFCSHLLHLSPSPTGDGHPDGRPDHASTMGPSSPP